MGALCASIPGPFYARIAPGSVLHDVNEPRETESDRSSCLHMSFATNCEHPLAALIESPYIVFVHAYPMSLVSFVATNCAHTLAALPSVSLANPMS